VNRASSRQKKTKGAARTYSLELEEERKIKQKACSILGSEQTKKTIDLTKMHITSPQIFHACATGGEKISHLGLSTFKTSDVYRLVRSAVCVGRNTCDTVVWLVGGTDTAQGEYVYLVPRRRKRYRYAYVCQITSKDRSHMPSRRIIHLSSLQIK
jgi:hypothetical protein